MQRCLYWTVATANALTTDGFQSFAMLMLQKEGQSANPPPPLPAETYRWMKFSPNTSNLCFINCTQREGPIKFIAELKYLHKSRLIEKWVETAAKLNVYISAAVL